MGRKVEALAIKVDAMAWAVKQASEDYANIDDEKASILYFVWEALDRILKCPECCEDFAEAVEPEWFKA